MEAIGITSIGEYTNRYKGARPLFLFYFLLDVGWTYFFNIIASEFYDNDVRVSRTKRIWKTSFHELTSFLL